MRSAVTRLLLRPPHGHPSEEPVPVLHGRPLFVFDALRRGYLTPHSGADPCVGEIRGRSLRMNAAPAGAELPENLGLSVYFLSELKAPATLAGLLRQSRSHTRKNIRDRRGNQRFRHRRRPPGESTAFVRRSALQVGTPSSDVQGGYGQIVIAAQIVPWSCVQASLECFGGEPSAAQTQESREQSQPADLEASRLDRTNVSSQYGAALCSGDSDRLKCVWRECPCAGANPPIRPVPGTGTQ